MRLLLTASFILLILAGCSRVQKEYYPDGELKSEITMSSGKRNGVARYYYESGSVQIECFYRNDTLDSTFTRYYTGEIREISQDYHKGMLHGKSRYWNPTGQLVIESHYQNGKLHGPYVEYYPNRHVKSEGTYTDGMVDGRWLYYSEAGNIIGTGHFSQGSGEQRSFYEDGRLHRITSYTNNVKDGPEVTFSPEGTVSEKIYYRQGELYKDTLP